MDGGGRGQNRRKVGAVPVNVRGYEHGRSYIVFISGKAADGGGLKPRRRAANIWERFFLKMPVRWWNITSTRQ